LGIYYIPVGHKRGWGYTGKSRRWGSVLETIHPEINSPETRRKNKGPQKELGVPEKAGKHW
jgi:hypothetical protein